MGYALISLPGPEVQPGALALLPPAEVWCRTRGARGRAEWVSVGSRFMVGRLWSAWHTHQRGIWRIGELRHGVIALRSMVADDFGTLVPVA